MKNHPKLLFLARPFPPLSAAGAVRSWYITKWLARIGWEVTVITGGFTTQKEIYVEEIKKELNALKVRWIQVGKWNTPCMATHWLPRYSAALIRRFRFWGIEYGFGWALHVVAASMRLHPEQYDVILATGSPFSSFAIAKLLSWLGRRPYILDYRDPWTFSAHHGPAPWWTTQSALLREP